MAAPTQDNVDITAALSDLTDWLIQQGLSNTPVENWLELFCVRLVEIGVPLHRVNLSMRAHHPEIGTVAFRWHRHKGNERENFQRDSESDAQFLESPIYHLVTHESDEIRQRLDVPDPELDFPIFDDIRAQGATDYFGAKRVFMGEDQKFSLDLARREGVVFTATTDAPNGFKEIHLDVIRQTLAPLCLTLKCAANRLMAEDITAAYMGRDASRRVLSGDITRGSSETISAVILYFDLQGFTKMSETLPGPAIIEMLNDYFGEVVEIVERHGGNVLKFMGDGMLAIFDMEHVPDARRVAIEAALELRAAFGPINSRRAAAGLATTGFTLGLHAGDVLYGNIGGKSRLDFTVIGPAVNTTSRMQGMCSAVDQAIVISAHVATPLKKSVPELVSLGQYRLRGVRERQELFTLDMG